MTIKTAFLLFLLLANIARLHAQTDNFLPGYVITLSGDSLSGTILYKGNHSKNNICIFRPEGQVSEIRYSPEELKMYQYYNDKCYVPLTVSIGEKEQTVFVEYLLNGIVSIYYYGYSSQYFIKDENGMILPLTDEEIEVNVKGHSYKARSKKYLGILKLAFKNDFTTVMELEKGKIKLEQADLISIGKQYHDAVCKEWECVVYDKDYDSVKKQERFFLFQRLALGVFSGLNYNFVPFSEGLVYENERFVVEATDVHTVQSFYPSIGLFVNYNLFFIHPKLDLRYEFSHNQQNSTTSLNYISGKTDFVNRHYDYELTMKKKYLNNTLLLKYNFKRISEYDVYVQGGYTLSYLFNHTYQRSGEYTYYGNNYVHQGINTPDINLHDMKLEHRIVLGLGCSRKIKSLYLFGDVRYQTCFAKTAANEKDISATNYYPTTYIGHDISFNIGVGFYCNWKN